MKNIFKKNKHILLLVLLFILLIGFIFNYATPEGFDLGSFSLDKSVTSDKAETNTIPKQYVNLAPLPYGYEWSAETQEKYVDFVKKSNPTADKKEVLTGASFPNGKSIMQTASEEEVKIFLEKKEWPWNDYVTNYLASDPATFKPEVLPPFKASWPNRQIYGSSIKTNSVPLIKLITDIFNASFFYPKSGENNNKWYCSPPSQPSYPWDFHLVSSAGDKVITDYSTIPQIIKGFSFEDSPCNICSVRGVQLTPGPHEWQEFYDSTQNKCKFKMAGDIPEAYNVYIGKYGNAPVESAPSSSSSSNNQSKNSTTSSNTNYNKDLLSLCKKVIGSN